MHIPRPGAFAGQGPGPFADEPQVNLTPLVDVVFQLVIFFVLAVPSIMLPMGIRVRLPITSAAARLEASRLEVTVTASDRIFLGAEEVTLERLRERARALSARGEPSAHIRGDVASSLGRVVAVYGALQQAGIKRISVATGIEVREK